MLLNELGKKSRGCFGERGLYDSAGSMAYLELSGPLGCGVGLLFLQFLFPVFEEGNG